MNVVPRGFAEVGSRRRHTPVRTLFHLFELRQRLDAHASPTSTFVRALDPGAVDPVGAPASNHDLEFTKRGCASMGAATPSTP